MSCFRKWFFRKSQNEGLYWQRPEKADLVGLASVSFLEPCRPPTRPTHILTHTEMTPEMIPILKGTVNTLVLQGGSWCFVFLPFQLKDDTHLFNATLLQLK